MNPPPTFVSANNSNTIYATQFLNPGEMLVSSNGKFQLVMQQTDGNLVLYTGGGPVPLWASQGGIGGTSSSHYPSSQDAHVVLQPSGSLIIYSAPQESPLTALWASPPGQYSLPDLSDPSLATYPNAFAVLGDDGNFVVYSDWKGPAAAVLWSTGTAFAPWLFSATKSARWWQNYMKTYAYFPNAVIFPASLPELVKAVSSYAYVKIVGAGWSTSDVNLPNLANADGSIYGLSGVDAASVTSRTAQMHNSFLNGFSQAGYNFLTGVYTQGQGLDLDLNPLVLSQLIGKSGVYRPGAKTVINRAMLLQSDIIYGEPSDVDAGVLGPAFRNVDVAGLPGITELGSANWSPDDLQEATSRLQSNLNIPDPSTLPWSSAIIDIGQLASSLQSNLPNIAASAAITAGFIPGMGPNAPPRVPPSPTPQVAKPNLNIPLEGFSEANGFQSDTVSAADLARGVLHGQGTGDSERAASIAVGANSPATAAGTQSTVSASAAENASTLGARNASLLTEKTQPAHFPLQFLLLQDPHSSNALPAGDDIVTLAPPPRGGPPYYFHVEAGIAIADLHVLLDRQSPRMAILGDSGNSEGTLAGVLSTGSHGAEFAWPLLTDTVKAIHLVGPGGNEWWIEGSDPVADPLKLLQAYPGLSLERIISSSSMPPGIKLTPQEVLNAITVSMGAIGAIYSVVLQVVPQYGIEQRIVKSTWTQLLQTIDGNDGYQGPYKNSGTVAGLLLWDPAANQAVLEFLLDGALNSTGIAKADNVYAELDFNPLTWNTWVINKMVTKKIPVTSSPSTSLNTLAMAAMSALGAITQNSDSVLGNAWLGSIFDYFGLSRDLLNVCNAGGDCQDNGWVQNFVNYINSFPDTISAALAIFTAQAQAGLQEKVLPTILQLGLDYARGTVGVGGSQNVKSTSVSHSGGSFWPDSGIAGVAVEIALPSEKAFSFIHTQVLNVIAASPATFLGFVSARICPPTQTVMGMQQFGRKGGPDYTVMVEIGAFRSPGAYGVIQDVLDSVNRFNAGDYSKLQILPSTPLAPLGAILHWAFCNDYEVSEKFGSSYDLNNTVFATKQLRNGDTPIKRFKDVKTLITGANTVGLFDNNFTQRLGLDTTQDNPGRR